MPTPVLVVEDNKADFLLLQEALADAGNGEIQLTHVDRLQDALPQLRQQPYEVVILDLSLPDTEGLDGLTRLREVAPELPVVVLTGRNDLELGVNAVRAGAQDYLFKGQVDGRLLIRSVRYATERMRSTQVLRRSEERFRFLLDNALDIITVIDIDGRISYASPSVRRVLGYSPEELVGASATSLVHPADRREVADALRMREPGTSCMIQFRIQHRHGPWKVLEAVGSSSLEHPLISGTVVNARDITDRRQAEEELLAAKNRLQAVIETSPLAIFTLNTSGRVLSWNKAAEKTFGWTEEEVLHGELPAIPPSGQIEFRRQLERVTLGQPFSQVEARYARKDGVIVDVNVWTSPLRSVGGEIQGLVSVVADVTERRRLEEQFRQSQKMEAVGRLAGGVAHDFNNLLTVITGYSQLASNRISAGTQEDADLREVMLAAERGASLTKQLLALSRRQTVEPSVFNLNSVVSDMQRMFQRIIGAHINFDTRLCSSLKPVRADRSQIELVFLNMVVNARDAMPGGGQVFIETDNVEFTPNDSTGCPRPTEVAGPSVVLSITDTGTGMSAQAQARLFEPFFTTKEPGKGTGLGLSTSYGIVRQHGGDIWVSSQPGAGTTFRIYLPAADVHPRPEPMLKPAPSIRGSETILIVEDDPGVANVMRDALEMNGYRILLTSSPRQAMEVAEAYDAPIHLVLADMVLHTTHGVDLTRQIRTIRSGVRVLYVSGYTGAAAPGHPFLEPGSAYLQKPFAPDALAGKVREVLNEN